VKWRQYLFGFSGRLNRRRYWLFIPVSLGYVLVGFALAIPYMLIEHPTGDHPLSPLGMLTIGMFGIVVAAFIVSTFSIYVQRLHDRNKSAWWLVPFVLFPNVMQVFLDHRDDLIEKIPPILAAVLVIAAAALALWAFVELGLLRGTVGANRYGPDPLAGIA
jgi:uncharacterized membrane protein YhaH (DUF805 family)